jgi:hypothetical protein
MKNQRSKAPRDASVFRTCGVSLLLLTVINTSIQSASSQDLLDAIGSGAVGDTSAGGTASEKNLVERDAELRDIEEQLLRKMTARGTSGANEEQGSARPRSTVPTVRTATYTAPSDDESPSSKSNPSVSFEEERRPSHSVSLQPASAVASPDQKLAIAESQVTILSRELETTRRGLRSAERRIEELSDLVKTSNPRPSQRTASDFSYGQDREVARSSRQEHVVPLVEEEHDTYEPTIRARSSYSATIIGKAAVRTGPSKSESMLFLLGDSSSVTIDRRTGEWYRVVTSSGARGWVYGQSLLFDTGVPASSAVKVRAVRNKYEPTGLRY